MIPDAPTVRRGRDFWQRLVNELEGGARVADVARRHAVQARTLSWWRWKLKTTGATSRGPMLLPIVVRRTATVARESAPIELRVRDVIIRVTSGSDVAYVAALVDALRS